MHFTMSRSRCSWIVVFFGTLCVLFMSIENCIAWVSSSWSIAPPASSVVHFRSMQTYTPRTHDVEIVSRLSAAGPATIEAPTKEKVKKEEKKEKLSSNHKKGGWAVRLFNDPMNKREFVAMCLCRIVGLSDGQAYSVMMAAHTNGLAVVGRYDFERAELYRNSLIEQGLTCDMIPVEED